jgi:hypothetical protein
MPQLGFQRVYTIQPRGWPSNPQITRYPDLFGSVSSVAISGKVQLFRSRRSRAMSAITSIPRPLPGLFSISVANKTLTQIHAWVVLAWPLGHAWVALGWPKRHPNPIPIGRGSQHSAKYQLPSAKYLLRLLTAYCQRSCAVHTLGRCWSIAASFKRINCESGQWINNRMDAVSLRSGHGPDMRYECLQSSICVMCRLHYLTCAICTFNQGF